MLYQNRDEEKWVVLTKSLNTIHAYFGRDSTIVGGGEVDPDVEDNLVFRTNSDSRDSQCSSACDSRRDSKVSICSLPASCLTPSLAHLAVANISSSPTVHYHPSPTEEKDSFKLEAPETAPSPSRISAKGLRNSFRKLVKPLVKKRMTDCEASPGEDSDEQDSRASSRRGSKGLQLAASCANLEVVEEVKVESRWKRVLGVSLAIGRWVTSLAPPPPPGAQDVEAGGGAAGGRGRGRRGSTGEEGVGAVAISSVIIVQINMLLKRLSGQAVTDAGPIF